MSMDQKRRDRIVGCIERNPTWPDGRVAKSVGKTIAAEVATVRANMNGTTAPQAEAETISTVRGVILANRRVLSRRPAESAAKHIRRLTNGKGYSPRDLAASWGMSEETIRKHARDMGCLKFVEVDQDDWQQMVMAPDTAANFQH